MDEGTKGLELAKVARRDGQYLKLQKLMYAARLAVRVRIRTELMI